MLQTAQYGFSNTDANSKIFPDQHDYSDRLRYSATKSAYSVFTSHSEDSHEACSIPVRLVDACLQQLEPEYNVRQWSNKRAGLRAFTAYNVILRPHAVALRRMADLSMPGRLSTSDIAHRRYPAQKWFLASAPQTHTNHGRARNALHARRPGPCRRCLSGRRTHRRASEVWKTSYPYVAAVSIADILCISS